LSIEKKGKRIFSGRAKRQGGEGERGLLHKTLKRRNGKKRGRRKKKFGGTAAFIGGEKKMGGKDDTTMPVWPSLKGEREPHYWRRGSTGHCKSLRKFEEKKEGLIVISSP